MAAPSLAPITTVAASLPPAGLSIDAHGENFQIKVDLLNKTNQAAIDLPPGTDHFYCSVSLGNGAGHAVNGMVGIITVH